MQAGYWGRTEAVATLKQRTGGVSRVPPVLVADASVAVGDWRSADHIIILCSAPEFSRPYPDGSAGDNVMKALEGLCEMHQLQVKFGYDWCVLLR